MSEKRFQLANIEKSISMCKFLVTKTKFKLMVLFSKKLIKTKTNSVNILLVREVKLNSEYL